MDNVAPMAARLVPVTVPRAAEAAGAEDIFDLMFGDDAPHSWIAMMNGGEQAS